MADNHYVLYRYNAIDGWSVLAESDYNDIQTMAEFELHGKDYILLAAKEVAAVLSVFHQHR